MNVRTKKIKIPNNEGYYVTREYDDFEYVNPIEHIFSIYIGSRMSLERDILQKKGFDALDETIERILIEKSLYGWFKKLNELKSIKLTDSLINLLEAKSKNEQKRSLKGLSLTSDELTAFIFMAFENYGYTYSCYRAKHNHKGLEEAQLPELIYVEENGNVTSIGETKLSKGQLKQAIEHRKITVSKFLDSGESWHCFFLTFKSLSGKESFKDGQPHLHYISDKWNIPRKEVVEQLTNKKYNLPSLPHIDFHTHRNPRDDEE